MSGTLKRSNETIVVTGGAGFVGSHLIRALVARYPDAQIISLDNYFTGRSENHLANERVRYLNGSTVDIWAIWQEQALPTPDSVFHLGEYARIVQSFDDIDLIWEYNMLGTKEVVRFCHAHDCKLIYAGSSSKFGNEGEDEHLSPYSWTKAKNIEYIKNFAQWFGLDYVITYFYNVYGQGQIDSGSYATVIGIFESQYRQGQPLTVVSPGTQTRDFTHVDDIVAGCILCYEQGQGDGYLIGSGHAHTILEVAEMFACDYVMIPERQGERMSGIANNSRLRSLGWAPKQRLVDYISAFKAQVAAGA